MDDCITISDDEDVCILKHVVNLEPIVVDLTDSDSSRTSPPPPPSPPPSPTDTQPQYNGKTSSTNLQSQPSVIPPRAQSQPEPQPQYQHQSQPQYQPPSPPQHQPQRGPQYQNQYQQQPQPFSPPQPKAQPQQQSQSSSSPQPPPHSEQQLQPGTPPQSNPQPQSEQQPHMQQNLPPKLSDRELLMAKKNLGNEKYKSNALNEAISIYRQASELAKRLDDRDMLATLHFNLAMTYDRLGSLNQAADECAKAVKLKDDYMKPHIKRADLYERMRKLEEAVICWEHICELDSRTREYAIRLEAVRDAAKRIKKRDPFAVLGINPITFTKEDLKKAYKRKALTHHPDRHPDADIVTRRIQEKLFKDASEAHSSIQLKYRYNMK